eukprot:gnl/TRDRNA2_/TRDRNA2_160856_c0_seq2.p1 gnl/TRDRNA2_/TRDRNA2_160856_c0~~gnl/TRDRNA2_/TRDRNA2_160856_c0_seq2.p1  ORF type:complete len:262 (-),score=34.87 gnl/TRDRNA2_/TRDRNA2_160856_c0_seq2:408-1193(-)
MGPYAAGQAAGAWRPSPYPPVCHRSSSSSWRSSGADETSNGGGWQEGWSRDASECWWGFSDKKDDHDAEVTKASDWGDSHPWDSWSKERACKADGEWTSECWNGGSWDDKHKSGDDDGAEDRDSDWEGWWPPGQRVIYHDMVLSPCRTGAEESSPRFVFLFFHSCSGGPEDVLQYVSHLWDTGLRPDEMRVVAPCSPRRTVWGDWELNSWYEYTTDRCWRGAPDKVSYAQFVEQRKRLLGNFAELPVFSKKSTDGYHLTVV